MNKDKHIIESKSFLGIKLFERIRVSNEKLEFEKFLPQSKNYNLSPILNLNKLSFNLFEIRDETTFRHTLEEIVSYTFVNLILNKTISLFMYEDKKKYLGGLYSDLYVSFYFTINSNEKFDYVSNILLEVIKSCQVDFMTKSDLKKVVSRFNNSFLGKQEIDQPTRQLLCLFLDEFNKTHSWINLNVESKVFNLYRNYEIDIENEYVDVLSKAYSTMQEIQNELEKQPIFKRFINQLLFLFIDDLDKRIPIIPSSSD